MSRMQKLPHRSDIFLFVLCFLALSHFLLVRHILVQSYDGDPSPLQGMAVEKRSPSHFQLEDLDGSYRQPVSFHFNGHHFLDSFVAPPVDTARENVEHYSGVYIVMIKFALDEPAPEAVCRFPIDGSAPSKDKPDFPAYESNFELPHNGEAYLCHVPQPALDLVRSEQKYIVLTITTSEETQIVKAALWPWHNRHQTYSVAATNMNQNMDCGRGNPDSHHCFHDWIIWHRNYGVEHFFLYDNGSDRDHPWLQAAKGYAEEGILTLISWPYQLGGTDNNMAQRSALNHAMYAVSARVKWLGYFDVDEFLTPRRLMLGEDNHDEVFVGAPLAFQENVIGILDSFASTVANESSSFLSIRIPVRNAQNPDTCASSVALLKAAKENSMNRTTRLSRCLYFDSNLEGGNPKFFVRVGVDGPRTIKSPHGASIRTGNAEKRTNTLYFTHFAKKYGCQNFARSCGLFDKIAMSKEVQQLEEQLRSMDRTMAQQSL